MLQIIAVKIFLGDSFMALLQVVFVESELKTKTTKQCTERDKLRVKHLQHPPTAQTVGDFGLIFGLGVHHEYISDAIEATFEFPPTS